MDSSSYTAYVSGNPPEFGNPTNHFFICTVRYFASLAAYIGKRNSAVPATTVFAVQSQSDQRVRRAFRWPTEARGLVEKYLALQSNTDSYGKKVAELIETIQEISGNPRDACWRFAHRAGLACKSPYRSWSVQAQQRLLDLIAIQTLPEVALAMKRSAASIRCMLHRLGASTTMGKDWFTKYTLAEALCIRVQEVQRWIDLGWLKSRTVQSDKLQRKIISADDFSAFCKAHSKEIVGRRLNMERLNFVKEFVFPPSHAEMLPVRDSKKERAAYEAQLDASPGPDSEDESEDELANSA